MKEIIARRWVEELRSDRHTQGKGALLSPSGAKCCLGVLQIDVLGLPVVSKFLLSNDAQEASGMGSDTGYLNLENGKLAIGLAELNDEKGLTFAQIANVIEAHWEKL